MWNGGEDDVVLVVLVSFCCDSCCCIVVGIVVVVLTLLLLNFGHFIVVMLVDFDDGVEVVEVLYCGCCWGMLLMNWLCGKCVSKVV